MFAEIGCWMVAGWTVSSWLGILAFLSLVVTASLGVMIHRRMKKIPLPWHIWSARITVVLGTIYLVTAYFRPCEF